MYITLCSLLSIETLFSFKFLALPICVLNISYGDLKNHRRQYQSQARVESEASQLVFSDVNGGWCCSFSHGVHLANYCVQVLCTSLCTSLCTTGLPLSWQPLGRVHVLLETFLLLFLSAPMNISGCWLLFSQSRIHQAKRKPGMLYHVFPQISKSLAGLSSQLHLSEFYVCFIYNVQGFYLHFAGEKGVKCICSILCWYWQCLFF